MHTEIIRLLQPCSVLHGSLHVIMWHCIAYMVVIHPAEMGKSPGEASQEGLP